jgi:uncharacterized MAPEG superfamily protein
MRITSASLLKCGAALAFASLAASPAAAASLSLPGLDAASNAQYANDLKYLVLSVALTIVQVLIAVNAATLEVGLPKLMGNREPAVECTGWAGRAQRAHFNMLESLPLFAILVLIEPVTLALTQGGGGSLGGLAAYGAPLFFYGRVAYAVIYIAGIPVLRTLAWFASFAGILLLLIPAFSLVS